MVYHFKIKLLQVNAYLSETKNVGHHAYSIIIQTFINESAY